MATVYIPFYSRYGSVEQMALAVADGVRQGGGEPTVTFVGDPITPPAVIAAARWQQNLDRLREQSPAATVDELGAADGAIFGAPTRYGNMAAQMKAFFDQTGKLWLSGATINKPAAFFTSTSTLHGGQEMTIVASYAPLIHLGYVVAGVPYSVTQLFTTTMGGTPYGPSHVAGPNSDQPLTDDERAICVALGDRVARLAKALKGVR